PCPRKDRCNRTQTIRRSEVAVVATSEAHELGTVAVGSGATPIGAPFERRLEGVRQLRAENDAFARRRDRPRHCRCLEQLWTDAFLIRWEFMRTLCLQGFHVNVWL